MKEGKCITNIFRNSSYTGVFTDVNLLSNYIGNIYKFIKVNLYYKNKFKNVVLLLIILTLAYFSGLTISDIVYPYKYADESYYIEAGISYLKGEPIYVYNWEHPPAAKYIIGFFVVCCSNPHMITWIAGYVLTILFFYVIKKIAQDVSKALAGGVLLATEVSFIKTFNYALLDVFAMLFSAIAMYVSLVHVLNKKEQKIPVRYNIIEGVFWGLAIASKWTSIYLLLGRLLAQIYISATRIKYRCSYKTLIRVTLIILIISAATYTITFARDFVDSPTTFVYHNVKMAEFMLSKHRLTIHSITKGLTLMFIKTTFWHRFPDVHITYYVSNGTVINSTMRIVPTDYIVEVDIMPSFGGFVLPLIPFVLVYALLTLKKMSKEFVLIFFIALSAIFPAFHGSLPWYMLYASYMWCLLIVLLLNRRHLAFLLLANTLYTASLLIAGLNKVIILGIG